MLAKLAERSGSASNDLRAMASPRRRRPTRGISPVERAAKRAEQKAAGVFDGRYRTRVKKSARRYRRRPKHRGSEEG